MRPGGRHEALRRLRRRRRARPRDRRRASSSPCSARRGCGKTTTLRMIAGFEEPTDGRGPDRRRRRRRAAAAQAPDQHRLPELRALPAPERRRERRLRPQAQEGRQGRDRARGSRPSSSGSGWRREANRRPEPALRRHAAARRAGARAGQPAQGAAARRAARRPRPEAPQGPAGRAEADPARGRDHVRLRHPRPGGGADDVGPDRGHEPRPGRAGATGPRTSTSARRRPSSPASSASRT